MRSEQEVRERIKELEDICLEEEDDCYLDEGEQAELYTLYWVLNEMDY